jgi:predicted HTH domain antitoxin
MKRTNIMLTDEQHRKLKSYARKEGSTLGGLVREALDATYKRDSLEYRKSVALEAYKEGLISLGKLSEVLGVDVVSARLYLKKHGIRIMLQRQLKRRL